MLILLYGKSRPFNKEDIDLGAGQICKIFIFPWLTVKSAQGELGPVEVIPYEGMGDQLFFPLCVI